MSNGKVTLIISEDESCLNPDNQKTFKIFIHDADREQLKKFCQTIETLMKERKEKLD